MNDGTPIIATRHGKSADIDVNPNSKITAAEVWPDRFKLTINAEGGEMSVVTTYTIDRVHLQALRQQIDKALH